MRGACYFTGARSATAAPRPPPASPSFDARPRGGGGRPPPAASQVATPLRPSIMVAQMGPADRTLDLSKLKEAFEALDARLPSDVTLVVGGGSAMMLGYGLPVRTTDVDAYPFAGRRLRVMVLGVEDLLIMKCFAGREKDVGHARALLRRKPDLGIVERRIEALVARGVHGAADAADFLDDLVESG